MPLDSSITKDSSPRRVVRGACPHDCPDTCALHVTVENGRAIKVEGDPEHPTTNGVLCTKVARYLERTYSDARVLHPLQRDRKSTRLNSSHQIISYAVFCLKHTAPPELSTLSLHDALPICGACPHDCPDTCALHVTVENGRAIKVEGDPEHPTTNGVLCTKVARYLERTYSDARVLHPLQ